MADTSSTSFEPATDTGSSRAGMWQTVEQAAVALGLSVRTVNRHISAHKLQSRLSEGRREVFVPIAEEPSADVPKIEQPVTSQDPVAPGTTVTDPTQADTVSSAGTEPGQVKPHSFLDLETALAMADRKADRKVELAVSAYQSLTRSIETQARTARRMAAVAWCIVGTLMVGVTVGLAWTATRVTKAEADSQHLKEQADLDARRLKEQADDADKRADTREKELADMRQQLSQAQEHAARAEGRAAVYEEMQAREPATRPTTRPNLIDRLTTAFGGGQ